MQIFKLSLLAVLVQLATFCLAIPLDLAPRGQTCSNAPNTVAGTPQHLTDFTITSLLDRGNVDPSTLAGIWCLPRSRTWVSVNFGQPLIGTYVTEILIDSYNLIGDTIKNKGDGPVLKGLFGMTRYGLTLVASNANNHQLTRAVLEGALTALWQYVRQRQYEFGGQWTITFKIFDGVNQVGTGSIELSAPPT